MKPNPTAKKWYWKMDIPTGLAPFDNKNEKAKSIALPFTFPDGGQGVAIITKIQKEAWQPDNDIKSVFLEWK